jgi:isoamylase
MPSLDPSRLRLLRTDCLPLGAHLQADGVRFSIFSRHATRVCLALFEEPTDPEPAWEQELPAAEFRSGDIWCCLVEGLSAGYYYMWRMDGPWDTRRGLRFDRNLYLLDPYARAFGGDVDRGTLKARVTDEHVHARDVTRRPFKLTDAVIYEVHLRGFTNNLNSGCQHPGTYTGFIEKLPYLRHLGVNVIEFLPLQERGEHRLRFTDPASGHALVNYWGYSTIGFFSPTQRYASGVEGITYLEEFRGMVDAIHDAGMSVVLDVVFNHTSEGAEHGPTLSFRGLDNAIYYLLTEHGEYLNYSGCGNTVNCNHPVVRYFILECLRYWVINFGIDGFRFDLASILSRNEQGNLREDAPLLREIEQDPVLRDVVLIAEAWDAGGAYQVGNFGGPRWAEWNDRFRDDVRRYWRNDPHTRPAFARRITGSQELYEHNGRGPQHSINFVTCHDGFTLQDLVSYSQKNNWMNGERNMDGADENLSFNCGVEGPTNNASIVALRRKMQKNFIATLFLSLGTPMFLGGDEFGRTQHGNNNAYCQDNEISWFDWDLMEQNKALYRFTRDMIALRKQQPALHQDHFFRGAKIGVDGERYEDIAWIAPENEGTLHWDGPETAIAGWIHARENGGMHLLAAFNNTHRSRRFPLPPQAWRVRVNTAKSAPWDVCVTHALAPACNFSMLEVPAQSVVVLTALAAKEAPTASEEIR